MTAPAGSARARWAWVLLAAATLLLAAHMFRYAPAGDGFYWDRWKHRECEAVDGTLDCTGVPPRVQAQPVAGG